MPVWQNMHHGRTGPSFLDNLKADAEVTKALLPREAQDAGAIVLYQCGKWDGECLASGAWNELVA